MPQTQKNATQKNKLNTDLFELVIAFNSFSNEAYLSSIIDYYDPRLFKNNDVKSFLNVLTDFYLEHEKSPNITELKIRFGDENKRKALKAILSEFQSLDKDFNPAELYKNTERFFQERAIYNNVLDIAEKYSDNNPIDAAEIYDSFHKACNISLIDDLGRDYFADIDRHCKELTLPDQYISTGWKWLDNILGGGLITSDIGLYVFSGTTNIGKSIFLGNIAINLLKQGKTIVLISLEMSEKIYTKRISSNLTKIPFSELTTQTLSLKDRVADFKQKNPLARLFVKEFPTKGISPNNINAYVKKLISKKGIQPDVIIIDYLNLMNPLNIVGSLYEDIKAVTEQTRRLCYTFKGVPIISATQLNRDAYNMSKPGLETQSESAGLSHTVDAQFSIWADEHEKDLGIIHLGVMKNRFGKNFGATTLRIDYDTLSIEEMDNEDIFTDESELGKISTSLENL